MIEVGAKFDFTNLGRFSEQYKRTFGELPSVALRRRALYPQPWSWCLTFTVGDVEHYQHAMTPPALTLSAEPPHIRRGEGGCRKYMVVCGTGGSNPSAAHRHCYQRTELEQRALRPEPAASRRLSCPSTRQRP